MQPPLDGKVKLETAYCDDEVIFKLAKVACSFCLFFFLLSRASRSKVKISHLLTCEAPDDVVKSRLIQARSAELETEIIGRLSAVEK